MEDYLKEEVQDSKPDNAVQKNTVMKPDRNCFYVVMPNAVYASEIVCKCCGARKGLIKFPKYDPVTQDRITSFKKDHEACRQKFLQG